MNFRLLEKYIGLCGRHTCSKWATMSEVCFWLTGNLVSTDLRRTGLEMTLLERRNVMDTLKTTYLQYDGKPRIFVERM